METPLSIAKELAASVKDYAESKLDSIKLNAAEKGSAVIANVAAAFIATIVLLFFMVFASLALSLILSAWIGKIWAGFIIVAGLYLLAGIIIWKCRNSIIRIPVVNALIKELFRDEKD